MRIVESGRRIRWVLISFSLAGIALAMNPALKLPPVPLQSATAEGHRQNPTARSATSADKKPAVTDAHPGGAVEVALTFDDLPAHGPSPAGLSRMDIANSIIHALQGAHSPPVYGFVNGKRLEEDPSTAQVLRLWHEAGFPLGNHTFSHMDLNANSLQAFEQDFVADEPALRTFMPERSWHWLRFPFLREGDTVEKHHAIAAFSS